MTTLKLVDTHTICPTPEGRSFIKGIKAGTKVSVNGKTFTTKASKSGEVSAYMLYVTESQALSGLLAGASKSTPVEVDVEVME